MNNRLKKLLYIILPSMALVATVLITIAITHGWYTNMNKMAEIDANTKNSGFKYEINGETLEKDEYSISNLVFFDINSIYEGKYFNKMVYEIELDIENITDDDLTYSVTFEGFRQSYNDGSSVKSISYVGCIMSPYKLGYEYQEKGKQGTTYYTYNDDTHEYTEYANSNTIADEVDISGLDLYSYNEDYIDDIYVITSDKTVMANKKYYQKISNDYREYITAGNKILDENKYYEFVYEIANEYDPSGEYYEIHSSSNGSAFYTLINNEYVTSSNYRNYYFKTNNCQKTTDKYFQNETYFLKNNDTNNNETYIELTTLTPGDSTENKNYYECGKKINSLIENDNSLGITYTPSYSTITNGDVTNESTLPFKVEYTKGKLGPKSGVKKNQKLYLYVFGVQEVNQALNPEFIEFVHDFRITISATTESSWTVVDEIEDNNDNNNGQNNGDNNG